MTFDRKTLVIPDNTRFEEQQILTNGDVVVGDADGVVVIPHQLAENAIKWAQHRVEVEKKRFADIAGEDIDNIYPKWVIPTLRAKGVLGDDETL